MGGRRRKKLCQATVKQDVFDEVKSIHHDSSNHFAHFAHFRYLICVKLILYAYAFCVSRASTISTTLLVNIGSEIEYRL